MMRIVKCLLPRGVLTLREDPAVAGDGQVPRRCHEEQILHLFHSPPSPTFLYARAVSGRRERRPGVGSAHGASASGSGAGVPVAARIECSNCSISSAARERPGAGPLLSSGVVYHSWGFWLASSPLSPAAGPAPAPPV